jgi:hypothetical protein
MKIFEDQNTSEKFDGEELEFFIDDLTCIGEVYLDGNLIFQSADSIDEESLEVEFYNNFVIIAEEAKDLFEHYEEDDWE